MLNPSLGLLLICLCWWKVAHSEIFKECGERTNVYLATSEGCKNYIYCDGENSFQDACGDDTPYFSETEQTCDTDPSVCKQQANNTSSTVSHESTQSSSTTSTPTGSTSTLKPTRSTTTFVNATLSSNTTVAAVVTATPAATTVPPIDSHSKCPASDDPNAIIFIPHSTSCSDYFMCYHGQPMAMHCSSMLHFDQKSQKCDYPENVHCKLESASPHEKCQIHTIDVYPHELNCNYYYLCRFGYLMVMQCPLNMDWDYEKKACRMRGAAKCYRPARKYPTI